MKTTANAATWSRLASRALPFSVLGASLIGALVSNLAARPQDEKDRPPATQESSPASNKGREVFGKNCLSCHGMRETSIQRKNESGWRESVYSMISRGAQVQPSEIEPLVFYLAATYGPSTASVDPGAADSVSGGAGAILPAGEGREILLRNCGTCHLPGVVAASHKSKDEWTETIERMVRLGAKLPNVNQKATLADYLAANFGVRGKQ
jgi:mono/diheme cytochrome c family protein